MTGAVRGGLVGSVVCMTSSGSGGASGGGSSGGGHKNAGKTVAEILKGKKASIKDSDLDPGSPSWADVLNMTWEEIDSAARSGKIGLRTIRKLLSDSRFNKVSMSIRDVLSFLDRLKVAKISYSLSDPTEGAIIVQIAVPGERWEVEFHDDGHIGVEVFASAGGVRGPEMLDDLFRRFSDS